MNVKTKILFVCIGSTCRSPMASAMVKARFNEVFDSLNVGISCSKPEISENSSRVIKDYFGLENAHIVPNSYQSIDLGDFDFLIVLDERVYKHLIENVSFPEGKLIPMFVADPFGGDLETYLKAAKDIEEKFLIWVNKRNL